MLSRVLGPGLVIFVESAAVPEIAGRYKPLSHCICSGGLALDRSVKLNYGIQLISKRCFDGKKTATRIVVRGRCDSFI